MGGALQCNVLRPHRTQAMANPQPKRKRIGICRSDQDRGQTSDATLQALDRRFLFYQQQTQASLQAQHPSV